MIVSETIKIQLVITTPLKLAPLPFACITEATVLLVVATVGLSKLIRELLESN